MQTRIHDLLTAIRRHPRWLAIAVIVPLVVVNLVVRGEGPATLAGPADEATVDAWLDAQIRDAGIPGAALVVVRDGRIVHERGFGIADDHGRPIEATTPFVIGSLSKSITALATMQLVDTGRVDLDTPVERYLPEFTTADPATAASITVRELLTHTSGLSPAVGVTSVATPAADLDDQVRRLATTALVAPPGTAYAYSNANYLVLGRLIEAVSGQTFGAYVQTHVFEPLEMRHAATDRPTAMANGLTDAHRLWFGLAEARTPADRPDLVPAGWISASADDLGRFLVAELEGGRSGGTSVLSSAAIATMQTATVPTGLGDERAAMGWYATTLNGEPILAHAGSTTEMAAMQILVPGRHLGVAVLFNAQSTMYELLHKPDAIGLGVVSLLTGREPAGTLQSFYPAFDVVVLGLCLLLVRGLVRLVRSGSASPIAWSARSRLGRVRFVGGQTFRLYLDVFVPLVLLLKTPDALGASWPALVRVDLGLVVLVLVGLRLADGVIRLGRYGLGRRRRPGSSVAGALSARGLGATAER